MEISPTKRAQIVALVNSGQKQIDVAEQLGVSQQLVSLTMKRWRDTDGFDSRRRSGRPRATTAATDRAIKRAVTINPIASSSSIAAALPTPISARTVRRRLSTECDLKANWPAKKPLLTRKNVKGRMSFSKKFKHYTAEMWEKVLWSDECNIRLMAATPMYVCRPTDSRHSKKICAKSQKCSILDDLGQFFGIRSRKFVLPPAEYNYERRTILVGPRTLEADDAHLHLHDVHARRRSTPHVESREVMAWG